MPTFSSDIMASAAANAPSGNSSAGGGGGSHHRSAGGRGVPNQLLHPPVFPSPELTHNYYNFNKDLSELMEDYSIHGMLPMPAEISALSLLPLESALIGKKVTHLGPDEWPLKELKFKTYGWIKDERTQATFLCLRTSAEYMRYPIA